MRDATMTSLGEEIKPDQHTEPEQRALAFLLWFSFSTPPHKLLGWMGRRPITLGKHVEENSTCNDLRGKRPRGKPSRRFGESRLRQQVVGIGRSCTMANVSAGTSLFGRPGRCLSVVSVTLHACVMGNTQRAVSTGEERRSGLTVGGFGDQRLHGGRAGAKLGPPKTSGWGGGSPGKLSVDQMHSTHHGHQVSC